MKRLKSSTSFVREEEEEEGNKEMAEPKKTEITAAFFFSAIFAIQWRHFFVCAATETVEVAEN